MAGVICQSQRRRSDRRWTMERRGGRGSKVGQVNRHLRRSYDANFKIMVVNAAEASNNCQPAKKYRVTTSEDGRSKKTVWKTLTVREKLIVVLKAATSKRLTGGYVSLSLRNKFWLSESFSEDLSWKEGSSYSQGHPIFGSVRYIDLSTNIILSVIMTTWPSSVQSRDE